MHLSLELERSRTAVVQERETVKKLQALVERTQADVSKLSSQARSQQERISGLEADRDSLKANVTKLHSAETRKRLHLLPLYATNRVE